jgi:phosphate:Na+ symporter
LLLAVLVAARGWLRMDSGVPAVLALFHTVFNLLGVALMLPLTTRLVAFLQRRFRTAEEDEARPRHLDRMVLATPSLAVRSLAMELARVGAIARRIAKAALSIEIGSTLRITKERGALDALVEATGEFTTALQESALPAELAELLPVTFRISGYYTEMAELAEELAAGQSRGEPLRDESLIAEVARLKSDIIVLLDSAAPERDDYSAADCRTALEAIQARYEDVKVRLLRAGVAGDLRTRQLVDELEQLTAMRHLAEQSEKAARHLARLWPSEPSIPGASAQAEP